MNNLFSGVPQKKDPNETARVVKKWEDKLVGVPVKQLAVVAWLLEMQEQHYERERMGRKLEKLELSDEEVDLVLERFDRTEPGLQRKIIAQFVARAAAFDRLLEALNDAPDPDDLGRSGEAAFGPVYHEWYWKCVNDGIIKAPEKKPPQKCKCCGKNDAIPGDLHTRCGDCQDEVPDRRGGWRTLGMYDG